MEPVKIHIPNELFEPAEMRAFSGEAVIGEAKINGSVYSFADPSPWRVEISNTGGALLVRGEVKAEGICACSRCLGDAHVSLEGDIEGYFVISPEGEDDDMEGDEFEALPESHDIDLAPLIIQGLMLDAPFQPLCQPECKGICPTCGKDLNEGECDCAEPEDGADGANPFAILKGLAFN